jgi:hypothetical protein
MDIEPAKPVVNGRMWQPGQSGNPTGRPVGSRTVFSQGFLKDLAAVWAVHGKQTMISTAQTNPAVFFATCARLIPADVRVSVEQTYAGLGPEDYGVLREVIAAVRQALPDADQQQPNAVLNHVLSALRLFDAKTISD